MTLYLKHLELYLMCKHLVSSAPYAQMCGRAAYSAGQVNNNHIWSQWWGQKSTAPVGLCLLTAFENSGALLEILVQDNFIAHCEMTFAVINLEFAVIDLQFAVISLQ